MAGFIQIIEIQTSRIEEVRSLGEQMRDVSNEGSTVQRGTYTQDLDRPGYYLSIVEFESRQSAQQNSDRPETAQFAAQLAQLCDAPPKFYNLEVLDTFKR